VPSALLPFLVELFSWSNPGGHLPPLFFLSPFSAGPVRITWALDSLAPKTIPSSPERFGKSLSLPSLLFRFIPYPDRSAAAFSSWPFPWFAPSLSFPLAAVFWSILDELRGLPPFFVQTHQGSTLALCSGPCRAFFSTVKQGFSVFPLRHRESFARWSFKAPCGSFLRDPFGSCIARALFPGLVLGSPSQLRPEI